MFSVIQQFSTQRKAWFLLFFSAICLELTALYFQYGMKLNPCVMCIYERVALFAIVFAGIVGLIAPSWLLVRLVALGLGLGGAIKGLMLSIQHVGYQLNPNPWDQCPLMVEFPSFLPLDQWLPAVFHPTGLCSEINWQFLGFTMVQWLVFIFAVYTLALSLILLSQFFGRRARVQRRLFH